MNCICKYGTSSWSVVQQELNKATESSRLEAEIAHKYWEIYEARFKEQEELDQLTPLGNEEESVREGDGEAEDEWDDAELEREFNSVLEETNLTAVSGVNKHFVELLLANPEINSMLNDRVAEGELACLEKWTEDAEWERIALKSSNLHLCRLHIYMSRRTRRQTRQRREEKAIPFTEDHTALHRLYRLPNVQSLFGEVMQLREERRKLVERRNKRTFDE